MVWPLEISDTLTISPVQPLLPVNAVQRKINSLASKSKSKHAESFHERIHCLLMITWILAQWGIFICHYPGRPEMLHVSQWFWITSVFLSYLIGWCLCAISCKLLTAQRNQKMPRQRVTEKWAAKCWFPKLSSMELSQNVRLCQCQMRNTWKWKST